MGVRGASPLKMGLHLVQLTTPTTPYYPYYPLRTVPLLPLLPPATPLLPLLSSTPTTQREVHVSCMYSVSVVLVLCMIFDVFLRACIGAWIVFFLDVS